MATLDPLGQALIAEVPAALRHGRGQYFTPEPLIELVLERVGPPVASKQQGSGVGAPLVLDPSCGSGRFLLGAARQWGLAHEQLIGVDSDPAAHEAARAQLPASRLVLADFLDWEGMGLVDCIVGNPPYVRRRGQRRDLYVDFLEHAARHLRPGGSLGFVLSSAWLDVGYGQAVRDCLRAHFVVREVLESSVERWFPEAKIQTLVLIAERKGSSTGVPKARFGELRSPLPSQPCWVRERSQSELPADRPWGPILRAPDLFFDTQRKGGPPWVPLAELARVRRGYTTNDNAFFYPPKEIDLEKEYTAPLLKGAKAVPGLRGCAAQLEERVLLCRASRAELKRRGAFGLLAWLERHRPFSGPESWALPEQEPARLFVFKGISDRFRQPLFDRPVQGDQQVYSLHPLAPEDADDLVLAAVLNSSWGALALECVGRTNFGEGVLWLGAKELRERLLLPDLRRVSSSAKERLCETFLNLPAGPVPRSAERSSHAEWGPAQSALDRAFGELASWTDEECERVASEAQRLCARRLARTRTS